MHGQGYLPFGHFFLARPFATPMRCTSRLTSCRWIRSSFGSTHATTRSPGLRRRKLRSQVQHIEAVSLDDVTAANGVDDSHWGVFFYAKIPNGFDFGFGWNPVAMQEESWKPEAWDGTLAFGESLAGSLNGRRKRRPF